MRLRWKYIDLSTQANTRLFDMTIGWNRDRWSIRILRDVPVTTSGPSPLFVKKSAFTSRYIVHPGGGGAAKLVCEECDAEYPYGPNPVPCAFCSVMKESGIEIRIWKWSWNWLWSDHGWAIRHNGEWVSRYTRILLGPMAMAVVRYKAKHRALAEAKRLEESHWKRVAEYPSDISNTYSISVEPYPVKGMVSQ